MKRKKLIRDLHLNSCDYRSSSARLSQAVLDGVKALGANSKGGVTYLFFTVFKASCCLFAV